MVGRARPRRAFVPARGPTRAARSCCASQSHARRARAVLRSVAPAPPEFQVGRWVLVSYDWRPGCSGTSGP
eukprot:5758805-Lingulodinium_polyedra.AAC.1